MEFKLFRCRICGDPYLGSEPPSFCPFCGAPQKYLVPAAAYVDRNTVPNLSARSRANLEKALDLEVSNAAFYMCASDCAPDPLSKAMFKALWRTEAEHASLICKILKVPKPEIKPDVKACLKDPKANFAAAQEHEQSAVIFYGQSAQEATEDRIKEVFTALTEVETYHIALSKANK
ncbi:MAG: ferritin-like domain-containing protein [Deltaproteobacteria bacterium]|nr:ferritin-like domain-containing protein [Deltaproteobacteria bacterium]